jgi:hypothetical protein
MRKFLQLVRAYINGDFAYENYRRNCGKKFPLDKKTFLKKRLEEKWNKPCRCC